MASKRGATKGHLPTLIACSSNQLDRDITPITGKGPAGASRRQHCGPHVGGIRGKINRRGGVGVTQRRELKRVFAADILIIQINNLHRTSGISGDTQGGRTCGDANGVRNQGAIKFCGKGSHRQRRRHHTI